MTDKTSLRKEKLKERDLISVEEVELAEEKITSLFIQTINSLDLNKVGFYIAVRNEIPTKGIFQYLLDSNIQCFVPVINVDLNLKKMRFAEFYLDSPLTKNEFDIFEPINKIFIDSSEMDLVILPVVAFDDKGYRLGMGKGYYDSTFPQKEMKSCPQLWALSYDFQKTESCYPEGHDLILSTIITPSGIKKF